MYPSCQ